MPALLAAEITIMAYGKYQKSKIMKKTPTFRKNILACYLGEQKNCSTEWKINLTVYFYSAGLQVLLAEGIADFEIMWKTKLLPTNSTQIWADKCYVFVRRSANVNLTQLDQNDLPRILLKPCLVVVAISIGLMTCVL